MAGHSKWANIKHKKAREDAKKGKIFTKLGREIAVAVKQGGSDPEVNSRLKDVIAKAKANNMPNDTIQRSIKKAAGELESVDYEEIVYEGYGPGGAALIVEVMTDNRNRTASDLRYIFDKNGGNLGSSGCVAWMFDTKGVIIVKDSKDINEDDLMMIAIEAGAEDFSHHDDIYEIITSPSDFSSVREILEKNNLEFESAQIERIPQNKVKLKPDDAQKMEKLIDMLEDNDDVQNIYHNWDIQD